MGIRGSDTIGESFFLIDSGEEDGVLRPSKGGRFLVVLIDASAFCILFPFLVVLLAVAGRIFRFLGLLDTTLAVFVLLGTRLRAVCIREVICVVPVLTAENPCESNFSRADGLIFGTFNSRYSSSSFL